MSNPGRFDNTSLLSGNGGVLFNDLLQPDYNQMQCDIRVMEDQTPFIEGTKCVLLLGQAAMHSWCLKDTENNVLNEMRGSPLYVRDIPAIASFFPQDAADIKFYEQTHNTQSKEYIGDDEDAEGEDEDEGDVKRFSNTKRSNYAFWLSKDIEKCKAIIRSGDKRWPVETEPIYRTYPPAQEVSHTLSTTKDHYLGLDIETDYEEQNLLCFSFSFYKLDDKQFTVYNVPVLNNDYHPAYSLLYLIIKGLAIAIRDNTTVAFNGAEFDFPVLARKYRIPVRKVYDPLIAQHRIYPDIEKSLGHVTSLYTHQRFHKDTDSRGYYTQEHMMSKMKYCGKDVFTMILCHQRQLEFARQYPGMMESIELGQRSIRPYTICSLQGIEYSEPRVQEISKENDRLLMQYMRIIEILIGPEGMKTARAAVKKGTKFFPSSNPQCVNYFHEQLGYNVILRSKKTGLPLLGKQLMYKLALQHPNNPVILFTLLYRVLKKEYSSIQFIPWKDDNNQVINYRQYIQKEEQLL